MSDVEKKKVLVIDDDDTIIAQVEAILDQNGFIPIVASNGPSGLEKTKSENPDVIMLDRRMPDMNGSEVLDVLKGDESTQDIPVIMLTGDNDIKDVSENFEQGAVDYIVKPFSADNIVMRIQKVLN